MGEPMTRRTLLRTFLAACLALSGSDIGNYTVNPTATTSADIAAPGCAQIAA